MVGREVGVDELLSEVLADRMFFEESGGGVSFSGGEPFQQGEFLLSALESCRGHGLHTAVDTCGVADTESVLQAARWTNLFLYDLKLMDSDRHAEFTGASNLLILENLRALARVGAQIWIRVPLIPGINDRETDLTAMADFLVTLPNPLPIRLLAYHETGLHKFRALGHTYLLKNVSPPSTQGLLRAAALFRRYGLEVQVGG
jgi:pyruvate formate lyase activating enzyme